MSSSLLAIVHVQQLHMVSLDDDASSHSLEEIYSDRLKFEHDLIGQRMTWLMTLNGFLLTGSAVLVANEEKFNGLGLNGSLLIGSIVGMLCNSSCLFSNMWDVRAISEARSILTRTWAGLTPEQQENKRSAMRLYGSDPRRLLPRSKPGMSRFLHPWLLLPITFLLLFTSIPQMSASISMSDEDFGPIGRSLYLAVLLPFVVIPLLDRKISRPT